MLVFGQRQSISATSAVSAKSAFWVATYVGALTGPLFVDLLRGRWKLLHLIVDGLSAHKALAIKEYAAELDGKLTVYYLPGYAPNLNPGELVWSHAKLTSNARRPLQKGERLATRLTAQLTEMARRAALIRSSLRHPRVAYISACLVGVPVDEFGLTPEWN